MAEESTISCDQTVDGDHGRTETRTTVSQRVASNPPASLVMSTVGCDRLGPYLT